MHAFCDESGGTGRDDALFLAAAAPLSAAEATRLMKRFRKAAGLSGEVKGSRLTAAARSVFFDLLGRCAAPAFGVVYCSGLDPLGNWALGALPEQDLWAELMIESALALADGSDGPSASLSLSIDRRYHGRRARLAQAAIAAATAARSGANGATVQFIDSESSDGIQVADVLANTAFRALSGREDCDAFRSLEREGRLRLRRVALATRRPPWLDPAAPG